MYRKTIIAAVSALILVAGILAAAEEETVDRVTVELTDPSAPAHLSVGLVNGGITVNVHDGEDVIVEARTGLRKLDKPEKGGGKQSGMTRIPVNSSSLTVEEYRNKVEIGTDSWANRVDLVIHVPRTTSLQLSCVNSGDIQVENIIGDIEASNTNGGVTLLNVSGSAVASAHNGNLTVTFAKVDPEKDMAFSSFNGDIDITFPASIKAKVKLKTIHGEVFTDFEIVQIENPERIIQDNQRESDGRYVVKIDRAFWGTINGGGQELQFSNYSGDIYIRKQK